MPPVSAGPGCWRRWQLPDCPAVIGKQGFTLAARLVTTIREGFCWGEAGSRLEAPGPSRRDGEVRVAGSKTKFGIWARREVRSVADTRRQIAANDDEMLNEGARLAVAGR